MSRPASIRSDFVIVNKFKALAEGLASYYSSRGLSVKPYHLSRLPHFSKLSLDRQRKAVADLEIFSDIVRSAGSSSSRNCSVNLWAVFKKAHLRPGFDFFKYINEDDKVEIYNFSGIQLWCNEETLKICSYTLEEIHSYDWLERYERSELDTQRILKAIETLSSLERGKHLSAMIPKHDVQERFSERKFLLDVQHDFFFPLYSEQNILEAFLVTSKVNILSSQPARTMYAVEGSRIHHGEIELSS